MEISELERVDVWSQTAFVGYDKVIAHTNPTVAVTARTKIETSKTPAWMEEGCTNPIPHWGAMNNGRLLGKGSVFFKDVAPEAYTCSADRPTPVHI